jgi:hypothetical protein
MSIKLGSKQPDDAEARVKGVKFSSYLLAGLFIILLVAPANHASSATDKEASIVFVVA